MESDDRALEEFGLGPRKIREEERCLLLGSPG